MTTARSISRVDSTVEMGIVNKVERDGVVYRDSEKCYVLDMVIFWFAKPPYSLGNLRFHYHLHQELTSNGMKLAKKIEHELVKDVIKYGKEEVFRKMMDRFGSCFKKSVQFSTYFTTFTCSMSEVFHLLYMFVLSVILSDASASLTKPPCCSQATWSWSCTTWSTSPVSTTTKASLRTSSSISRGEAILTWVTIIIMLWYWFAYTYNKTNKLTRCFSPGRQTRTQNMDSSQSRLRHLTGGTKFFVSF